MGMINDLDTLAWAATAAALVVCACLSFLFVRDWSNEWPIGSPGQFAFVVYPTILCFVAAVVAWSPSANVPRKTVEGIFRIVAKRQGRRGPKEFICVNSCALTGGYALAVDSDAAHVLRQIPAGKPYRFVYLDSPSGNALTGRWLRLTIIEDPESGQRLYDDDPRRHPYRAALYLGDTLLVLLPGMLWMYLRKHRKTGLSGNRYRLAESEIADDSLLHLNSEGREQPSESD